MRPRWTIGILFALLAGALANAALAETGLVAGVDLAAAVDAGAVARIEDALARLDAEAHELRAREAAARGGLTTRIRALYRLTRPGAAPLGGGFDAVRQHLARVRYLERTTTARARELARLGEERIRLGGERERVAAGLSVARARAVQAPAVDAMPGDFAFPEDDAAPRDEPFYGLRLVDGAPIEAFEAKRGALASPIRGEVRLVDVGGPRGDDLALDLQTPIGTSVRAVAAGRVAFVDDEPGQGQVVVVDHGGGYSTLYGGLGVVDVRRGDDLSEGARLGSIGGARSPPALHFQVHRSGRALAPREWLGF